MRLSAPQLCLCALMAALIALCSQIQLPLPPIPINLALLAVFISGGVLGKKGGVLATAVYLMLGLCGLPVFAGLQGGPGVLFGPTGGYLMGYLACAWLTGIQPRRPWLGMGLGLAACYFTGSLWYMLITQTPLCASLSLCVLPFIPGDIVKILLALLLTKRLQKRPAFKRMSG